MPRFIAPRGAERNAAVRTETGPMQTMEPKPRRDKRRAGTMPRNSTNGALQAALERTEREAVEKVLARTNGNVAEAAAMLGILRTSLYRIMKRCGIASSSRPRN